MSNNASDNKIVVKFEIQIPTCGGTPVVLQTPGVDLPDVEQSDVEQPLPVDGTGMLAMVPAPRQRVFALENPQNPANVKVTGTNTTGVICASAAGDTNENGTPPHDVRLKVYRMTDPIDGTPPSDAVQPTPEGTGGTFSSWIHNAVPGAQCGLGTTGSPNPLNRLAIWREYEELWFLTVSNFLGQCASQTDCDETTEAASALSTYPEAWRLVCRGFRGVLEGLNGDWTLAEFPHAAEGFVVWLVEGDGVEQPRLEFFGKRCGCEPFELRLVCAGKRVVYRVARRAFCPLGVNRLSWANEFGAPEHAQFPTSLQIVPA